MSLRIRLLISYVLIVAVFLCIIVFAAIVLLRDNPLQNSIALQRLATAAQVVARLSRPALLAGTLPERLFQRLEQIETADNARVLFVEPQSGEVLVDSAGEIGGERLADLSGGQHLEGEVVIGEQTWLYAAAPVELNQRRTVLAVVASPETRVSLLRDPVFLALMRPLLVAAAIALVVALVLSAVVTRSIVRPIQHVASAANAIAAGDPTTQAPIEGPVEVQELATNFNTMAARVRASQQSQRDFLANVSHELKTPLTSIRGFAQAIADGAAGDAESIRKSASIIREESERMARMVGELLDLARIETGQILMQRAPVPVGDVLRGCVERHMPRAKTVNIRIELEIPAGLPAIQGDGDRLAQVFDNLLDNALKHTPGGGRVGVSARAMTGSSVVRRGKPWPGAVEVNITDTGPGIPPEDLTRIFERFYQVDKSRARSASGGSLGLGLAIAKEIVIAHGGSIHAESVTGLGTKFVVRLPIEASAPIPRAFTKSASGS